jgi:hypothetical protein
MAIAYDAAAVPDTYPVVTNGARNAWLKVLTLTTAGLARVEGLQIGTVATLNWQSPVITVTLTGAATQLITVAVPGATGIFVEATNARITGEVTGTGANNVTIHNPALLTGSVSLVLERYV